MIKKNIHKYDKKVQKMDTVLKLALELRHAKKVLMKFKFHFESR
jgi:hypothetical protein